MLGTLKLLNSSTILALSGAFRLYVAYLFLKIDPILLLCLAAGLIVYSVYTFDRTVKSKEDEINRSDEMGIKVRGVSIKLKGGLGVKNVVVAFTWAVFLCSLIYWDKWMYLPLVFSFFFLKSFVNTVICDCRDVEGDSYAGLNTFPVCWGLMKTRRVLQAMHSTFHVMIMVLVLLKLVDFDVMIIGYSWLIGVAYIHLYATTRRRVLRSIVIHGEWVHMVVFRELAQLILSPSRSV